jgi:hypothetical protein
MPAAPSPGGAVWRLEVHGRLAVVLVRPGGVTPAGQRHGDQRADIDRQPPAGPGPAVPERTLGGPGHRGVERRPGNIAKRPIDHGVIEPAVGGAAGPVSSTTMAHGCQRSASSTRRPTTHPVPGPWSTTSTCPSPSGRAPATAMAAAERSGVTSAANATGSAAADNGSARASQSASAMTCQSAGISPGHQFRYARQKSARSSRSNSAAMRRSVTVCPSAGMHARRVGRV